MHIVVWAALSVGLPCGHSVSVGEGLIDVRLVKSVVGGVTAAGSSLAACRLESWSVLCSPRGRRRGEHLVGGGTDVFGCSVMPSSLLLEVVAPFGC